nr:ATP-binding protein [Halomicrobium katesii]
MPPSQRETIFERGFTTSEEGTGFGLAIVDTIVRAHDWSITVGRSDAGGARFEVTT